MNKLEDNLSQDMRFISSVRHATNDVLRTLDARIIRYWYGISLTKPLSPKEISVKLGLDVNEVIRRHSEAVEKITWEVARLQGLDPKILLTMYAKNPVVKVLEEYSNNG